MTLLIKAKPSRRRGQSKKARIASAVKSSLVRDVRIDGKRPPALTLMQLLAGRRGKK